MVIRFVEYLGEKYRVLREEGAGTWLISFDAPAAPLFASEVLKRIETPSEFLGHS